MWQGSNYNENLTVSEVAKLVRNQLKEEFPKAKWSVRTDGSSINIALMEYDKPIATVLYEDAYLSINHYAIERNKNISNEGKMLFIRARDIAQSYNYDDSNGMIDYFDYLFVLSFSLGRWDKPFKVVKKIK